MENDLGLRISFRVDFYGDSTKSNFLICHENQVYQKTKYVH